MTIINAQKNKSLIYFLLTLFTLIIAGGLFYIYQYNLLAERKINLDNLKSEIEVVKVQNAELKNKLFQLIDPTKVDSLASRFGLVIDKSPNYLKSPLWVSDSSH